MSSTPPMALASTPEPPYYAVIFTSIRAEADPAYTQTAEQMVALAATQPGFLGVESVRADDGFGVTVSYWRDAETIVAWKQHADHLIAQKLGRERWYRAFTVRVCKVERAYSFGG